MNSADEKLIAHSESYIKRVFKYQVTSLQPSFIRSVFSDQIFILY